MKFFILFFCLEWLSVFTAQSQTSYEAASATLSNGAVLRGQSAGQIGGDDNGAVDFKNVVVPKAGLYAMTVYFQVSDDRSFDITVNNEPPRSVIFRKNARKNKSSQQSVLVSLQAGGNSIVFNNPYEYGPELERISVGSTPVESHLISGEVNDPAGNPLPNAEVLLSGSLEKKVVTDGQGRYQFKYLPDGEYRVAPFATASAFAPDGHFYPALRGDQTGQDFTERSRSGRRRISTLQSGGWTVAYDLAAGTADILFDKKLLLRDVYAEAHLPGSVTSLDGARRNVSRRRVKDQLGSAVEFQVESLVGDGVKMIQKFWFYDHADYFVTQVEMTKKGGLASNFMAPLMSHSPVRLFSSGDNRALFVPFDNDKWIRYEAFPFGRSVTSYEVSALYNNADRHGLIVGSIDHDTWKTGVKSDTFNDGVAGLEVFGGISSTTTRDTLPHGKIAGETIASPRVFVGFFADWRKGLETFAQANARIAPPRPWSGGVPFGWNSWGKLQFNVTFDKAIEVSDFYAGELQPHHFEDKNTVYIGLDAGWSRFTDDQLKQFADHCHANHQQAGIYFTPFTDFGHGKDGLVEGSQYKYSDIYLYAHGQKQRIAGGFALDPTHPGTKARIVYWIDKFKSLGFSYVKADFMVHGSLEGDHHFDPRATTGLRAYNEGMNFLSRTMGTNMYLNLAISPLFPSQYADSRRIACDSWGDIGKVEYTLNSLTYGWWLSGDYDYNDPDHIVLGGYTDGENRARVTSAVLTGLCICGDDFSKAGDPEGKEKARKFLTNPDIDALGRIQKSFEPVEGDTGNRAATLFVYKNDGRFYLAAFNYSHDATNISVSFDRIGLVNKGPLQAKELWSGQVENVSSPMNIPIAPATAVIYEFQNNPARSQH